MSRHRPCLATDPSLHPRTKSPQCEKPAGHEGRGDPDHERTVPTGDEAKPGEFGKATWRS